MTGHEHSPWSEQLRSNDQAIRTLRRNHDLDEADPAVRPKHLKALRVLKPVVRACFVRFPLESSRGCFNDTHRVAFLSEHPPEDASDRRFLGARFIARSRREPTGRAGTSGLPATSLRSGRGVLEPPLDRVKHVQDRSIGSMLDTNVDLLALL